MFLSPISKFPDIAREPSNFNTSVSALGILEISSSTNSLLTASPLLVGAATFFILFSLRFKG